MSDGHTRLCRAAPCKVWLDAAQSTNTPPGCSFDVMLFVGVGSLNKI